MKRLPKWLRYALALTLVLAVAAGLFIAWEIALASGVWPLAPSKPVGWRDAPASAAIQGCYELSLSDWSPRISMGDDAVFMTPPQIVELTSEPSRWQGFVMRPLNGGSKYLPFGYWGVTPDRTVYLTWSNGFSGVTTELGPQGPVFVGRACSFWDFPRITQWATATATRVRCPNSPEVLK
jgi:hypothetical protein